MRALQNVRGVLLLAFLGGAVAQPSVPSASHTITIRDLMPVFLEVNGEVIPTRGLAYLASFPTLPQSIRLRQWHGWTATLTDTHGTSVTVSARANFNDPAWVNVPLDGLVAPLTLIVERNE